MVKIPDHIMLTSQGGGDVPLQELLTSHGDVETPNHTRPPSEVTPGIDSERSVDLKESLPSSPDGHRSQRVTCQHLSSTKVTGQHHTPPLSVYKTHTRNIQEHGTQDNTCQHPHPHLARLSSLTSKKLTLSVHVLVALVMGQVSLTIGLVFGFTGITLPQLTDQNGDDLYLTPVEARLFGSLFGVGAMVGALVCVHVMVRLGQRTTQLIGMITFVVGWCTLALTLNTSILLSCFLVLSFAFTLIKNSVTTYTLEVTHEKHRGLISGITIACNFCGCALPTYIGMTGISWRQLAFVNCGLNLIPIIGVLLLPNSPRWLVTRNRISEAKKALRFFRGSHQSIEIELGGIISQVNSDQEVSVLHQVKLLFQPKTRRIFCFQLIVAFLISMTGAPTIQAYLMVVMQGMEVDFDPHISAVLYSALQLIGLLIPLLLIDKVGRKPLLVVPLALNSVSFMSFIISSYLSKVYTFPFLLWVPLVSTLVCSFLCGIYFPVLNILQGELIPTSCRAVGVNVLDCIQYNAFFLSNWSYPLVEQKFGQLAAIGVFSGCSAVLVPICAFALPETKGRSLEDICT